MTSKKEYEVVLFVGGPLDGERKRVHYEESGELPVKMDAVFVEHDDVDLNTNPVDNVRSNANDNMIQMEYHLSLYDGPKLSKLYVHRGVGTHEVLSRLIEGYQVQSKSDDAQTPRRLMYVNRIIRAADKHCVSMKSREEIAAYRNDLMFYRQEPGICNCGLELQSHVMAMNATDCLISVLNWVMGNNFHYDQSVEQLAKIVRTRKEAWCNEAQDD